MKYIITALKIEAQAFVDRYKLGKSKSNDELSIIVSGLGSSNMFHATAKIVALMNDDDIILNIGICGASKEFEISELIKIDFEKNILTCVDEPVSSSNNYDAVDMESTGFIDATSSIKNRYMFKVVSDHFEPHVVTKDKTKKLIYDKIDEIMESLI